MIRLLKNKEVRSALILQLVLSLAAVTAIFFINKTACIITLLLSLLLITVYLLTTYARYKKLSALAADINKLLHTDRPLALESYCEGELGILHSEVYKMTVRLREQQQSLLNDKLYLAVSIADISHQVRTPLTSLFLLTELLSDPKTSGERRAQLTFELKSLLSRIDWLITTLLKISKLDAGTVQFKKERICAQSFLEKACAPLLVPIELRGQKLIIDATGELEIDPYWTSEAIGNILKNCMEHTNEGGELRICANDNPLYSEITVADTGTGISPLDLPHIFERFYKGENSDEKSFGVGLALARMIITEQNGTVKAENRPSGGAIFTVRFYKSII